MSNLPAIQVSANLPAFLQQAQFTPSNLGAGIKPSAPRLGITITRQFTVTRGGGTQILPNPTVNVVLLGAAPTLNKAWFAKAYVPGSDAQPDCFSDDGKAPAAGAEHKQSANCSTCPKNAFGSHPITGRGKACGDRKRVALVLADEPGTAMTLNMPTMSLTALRNLDAQLEQARIPLQGVVLQLAFDQSVQYSKLIINPVGFVDEKNYASLAALAATSEVQDLLRRSAAEDGIPEGEAGVPSAAYGAPVGMGTPTPAAAAPAPDLAAQQAAVMAAQVQQATEEAKAVQDAWTAQQAASVAAAQKAAWDAQQAVQVTHSAATPQEQAASVAAAQKAAWDAQQAVQVTHSAATPQEQPATEPAKRKRRTKAEMEAARAAEAASVGQAQQAVQAAQPTANEQMTMQLQQPAPNALEAQQAELAAQIAALEAQKAAFMAQQAAVQPAASQPAEVLNAVQSQAQPTVQPSAGAASNVLDLISKWKQG